MKMLPTGESGSLFNQCASENPLDNDHIRL